MEIKKSISTKLTQSFDDYYKQPDRPRVIGHYNVSELGTCFREWFWRYTDPQPISEELQRIFNYGHLLHEHVDKCLDKAEDIKVIANEKGLLLMDNNSGAVLHGRVDNVVEYNGVKYIIDTKSTKSVEASCKYPTSDGYKMQLNVYGKFFDIDNLGLFYVEKGTLNTGFKEVKKDDKFVKMAFDRMATVHKHLTENTLPEPEVKNGPNQWMCRYCSYADKCKEVCENGNK